MKNTEKQITDVILSHLEDLTSVDKTNITRDCSFSYDLFMDSLETFELAMWLEETFNVSLPWQDIEKMTTVGQAIDAVWQQLQ